MQSERYTDTEVMHDYSNHAWTLEHFSLTELVERVEHRCIDEDTTETTARGKLAAGVSWKGNCSTRLLVLYMSGSSTFTALTLTKPAGRDQVGSIEAKDGL